MSAPAPGTFAATRILELAPFANGPQAQALAIALGGAQDDEVAQLRIAALSRFPALCPDDALDGVGAWLALERFLDEVDDVYRARLVVAWPTWQEAGSAAAVIDSLAAYGIPEVAIKHDDEGYFADGAGYARFWVFILPTTTVLPFFLGTGIGSTNGPFAPLAAPFVAIPAVTTLGSTATLQQVKAVKSQILKWKAAHGYPVKITLVFADAIVANCGVDLVAPFVCGGGICVWNLGKLTGLGENIEAMPFVYGGYDA